MPETSESENPLWKLEMAHKFLLRSIFSDGYAGLLKDKEPRSSIECGGGVKVKQDTSVEKVSYVKSCLLIFIVVFLWTRS